MNARVVVLVLLVCSQLSSAAAAQETAPSEAPLAGERNYLTGYPALNADGSVNVVIECPAGTSDRWEVADDGLIHRDYFADGTPVNLTYLAYPANYGMIPGTLLATSLGGEGEPLDVFVLGAAVERGTVIRARVIGALALLDDGEQDDKLVAVIEGTTLGRVRDIEELDRDFPGITEILKTWVLNFKGVGSYECFGYIHADAAKRLIDATADAFEEEVRGVR